MTSATLLRRRQLIQAASFSWSVVVEGLTRSKQLVARSTENFKSDARATAVSLISALSLLIPLLFLVIGVFMLLHANLALIIKLLPLLGFMLVGMPTLSYMSSAVRRK